MKPNFALNLSHDGIGLLFRARSGWELLGEVALDAEDFNDQLSALRREAKARAGNKAVTTKLVIPASQILYTEITAPGPHAATRRKEIAAALEGLTPYAVEDLVFDWSGHGDVVQVAVVARETLAEAEAFAEDRGFAPVSFVAIPEAGQFAGEPWFGPTSVAPAHLSAGARIERDQDPLPFAALLAAARANAAPEAVAVPSVEESASDAVEPAEDMIAASAEAFDEGPSPEPQETPEAEADTPEPEADVAPVDDADPEPESEPEEPQDAPPEEAEGADTLPPDAPEGIAKADDGSELQDLAPEEPFEITEGETAPIEEAAPDTDADAPELAAEPAQAPEPEGALPDEQAIAEEAAPETTEPELTEEPSAPRPEPAPDAETVDLSQLDLSTLDWSKVVPQTDIAPDAPLDAAATDSAAEDGLRAETAEEASAPEVVEDTVAPDAPTASTPIEDTEPQEAGKSTDTPPLAPVLDALETQEPTLKPMRAQPRPQPRDTLDSIVADIGPAPQPPGPKAPAAVPTAPRPTATKSAPAKPPISRALSGATGREDGARPPVLGPLTPRAPQDKAMGKAGVTAPGLSLPWEEDRTTGPGTGEKLRKVAGKVADAGLRTAALGGAALSSGAGKALARGKALAEARSNRPRVEIKPSQNPEGIDPEKTVFGGPKPPQVGGKPKYLGVTLMAGLIGVMALAALWSSYLGSDAPETPAEPEVTVATPAPTEPAPDAAPMTVEEARTQIAEIEAQAEVAPAPVEDPPAVEETPEAEPEQVASVEPEIVAPPAETAPPEEPAAAVVAEEPAPEVAAPAEPIESALSSSGTVVPGLEPLAPLGSQAAPLHSALATALPPIEPEPTEPTPVAPEAPAMAEASSELVPTPEGTPAPGGFTLYSGKPPRVSRPRPASVTAAVEAARAAEQRRLQAMERIRPKARPEAVVRAAQAAQPEPAAAPAPTTEAPEPVPEPEPSPAPQPEANPGQQGTLIGPSPRLSTAQAAIVMKAQPKPRPDSVVQLAAAARAPAEPEEIAAAEPFPNASETALAVSRRPQARPRNFSAAVERALAAAIAAEPPQQTAAAAPPRTSPSPPPAPTRIPGPEEVDEPEPTRAAPRVPTSASVAKQATQRNALNLGEVSLIGLYGTQRNRSALVRMPNGRFYKVKVGDRLDGGKVVAIGDSQLSYQKGNRTLVLKLLRGG
ncbi:hypothetical protein SAMN05877809_101451 [Rhodobacter sp. JA431]|uniref:hypothetical protein n=1 Tax=Rhodobacter sp. JA431 TaxID=570013 RepID=UPI000BDDA3D6|nr:hypothetical protein [Rhodobacter sp. JA431]SOB91887.1 hypothetical protein SAMN05877809_101451 [Rhodobacter sp. JA431]